MPVQFVDEHAGILGIIDRDDDQLDAAFLKRRLQGRRQAVGALDGRERLTWRASK